jgi:hypothetical protein
MDRLSCEKSELTCRSMLYANKINPSIWQDINQVEQFGFLSMFHARSTVGLVNNSQESKSNRFIW